MKKVTILLTAALLFTVATKAQSRAEARRLVEYHNDTLTINDLNKVRFVKIADKIYKVEVTLEEYDPELEKLKQQLHDLLNMDPGAGIPAPQSNIFQNKFIYPKAL